MSTETPALDQRKLTPEQAAECLDVSVNTLAVWRLTNRYALPFIKIGRNVRYLASDLEAFLQKQRTGEVE